MAELDYLTDIKPLQDQGVSDQVIAQHLSDRTAEPISNNDARAELQESAAVVVDPANPSQRSGTLIDYYQTLPAGDTATLVAWFINAVFGTDDDINTDQYPRSIQFAAVQATLPLDLEPVAAAIVEKAGGRPNLGTTEADVIACQAEYEAETQAIELTAQQQGKFDGLVNLHIAPLVASNTFEDAAWQNACNQIATDWGA